MNTISFNELPSAVSQLYEKVSNIEKMLLVTNKEPLKKEKEDFMLIKQAAEYLSLSVPTVYGLVHRNEIPYYKRGKRLYFLEKDLEVWLKTSRKMTIFEIRNEADQKLANSWKGNK